MNYYLFVLRDMVFSQQILLS